MRKLKIGIMGARGIPNQYGGFEQFAEHLSVSLVNRGHDVSVYNSSLHPYREKEFKGVQVIHCRDLENKLGTAGQFIYDFNCISDARKRKYEVLLHLGYTSDSIWYWRWPRQSINMMNMDGMEWQRSKYSKPVKRFLRWAEGLAVRHLPYLIADSTAIQEYFFTRYGKKPAYIPYAATPFTAPSPLVLEKYRLLPQQYFLVIARIEPENNIEMIIKGYLSARHPFPLFIIGNINNKYGGYLQEKYRNPGIRFCNGIYNQEDLNNLRYYSHAYFHGHSVGGTNPSLLEAMACQCHIAAHANGFNRAVLEHAANYFSSERELTEIIQSPPAPGLLVQYKAKNLEKIRTEYTLERITDAYESLMLSAAGEHPLVVAPPAARAV